MKTIVWNEKYLIGIDHLDKQHKKMLDLVNLFLETTFVENGPDLRQHVLSGLMAYVKNHFRDEETLMRQSDYPGQEAHRGQHQELITQLNHQIELWKDGQDVDVTLIRDLLTCRLFGHIGTVDKKMGEYLHSLEHSASANTDRSHNSRKDTSNGTV